MTRNDRAAAAAAGSRACHWVGKEEGMTLSNISHAVTGTKSPRINTFIRRLAGWLRSTLGYQWPSNSPDEDLRPRSTSAGPAAAFCCGAGSHIVTQYEISPNDKWNERNTDEEKADITWLTTVNNKDYALQVDRLRAGKLFWYVTGHLSQPNLPSLRDR